MRMRIAKKLVRRGWRHEDDATTLCRPDTWQRALFAFLCWADRHATRLETGQRTRTR